MNISIIDEAKLVLKILNENQYEAYLVGGCVRDFCLNKVPSDYDITSNALPDIVKKIFSQYKTIDTGMKHGTVGIIINKHIIEVTTYRVDGNYLDWRHPSEVTFTTLLKEDLNRRDFTMNALALSKEGQVVDYFGGVNDINQQIIKTVDNPYLRFQEDALRILRALRFSSVLGFKIENNTKKAMLENLDLLDHISKERINTELVKLLLGDYVKEVFSQYQLIFIKIIPLFKNITQEQYSKIYNNMIKLDKDIVVRLSLLLMDFKTDEVVSMLKQLKFDNKTIEMVKKINSHLLENITDNKVIIKRLLNIIDYELFIKLIKIKQVIEPAFKYDNIIEILNVIIINKECYRLKDLMIKGSDLEKLGILGVNNGVVLNELLHAVINEECSNVKEELINYTKKYLK